MLPRSILGLLYFALFAAFWVSHLEHLNATSEEDAALDKDLPDKEQEALRVEEAYLLFRCCCVAALLLPFVVVVVVVAVV